jgi:hypothetical protein
LRGVPATRGDARSTSCCEGHEPLQVEHQRPPPAAQSDGQPGCIHRDPFRSPEYIGGLESIPPSCCTRDIAELECLDAAADEPIRGDAKPTLGRNQQDLADRVPAVEPHPEGEPQTERRDRPAPRDPDGQRREHAAIGRPSPECAQQVLSPVDGARGAYEGQPHEEADLQRLPARVEDHRRVSRRRDRRRSGCHHTPTCCQGPRGVCLRAVGRTRRCGLARRVRIPMTAARGLVGHREE